MKSLSITTGLAIWGSILSTIAVIWNGIRSWKDRERVKIRLSIQPEGSNYSILDYIECGWLELTITKLGRRTITFDRIWIDRKNELDYDTFAPDNLILKEGEKFSHKLMLSAIKEGSFPNIKGIFARDSTGKKWGMSKRKICRIMKKVGEIIAEWNSSDKKFNNNEDRSTYVRGVKSKW